MSGKKSHGIILKNYQLRKIINHFGFIAIKHFQTIWLSNLSILSVPVEGYSTKASTLSLSMRNVLIVIPRLYVDGVLVNECVGYHTYVIKIKLTRLTRWVPLMEQELTAYPSRETEFTRGC